MINFLGNLTGQFGTLALHLSAGKEQTHEASSAAKEVFYTLLEIVPELLVTAWRVYLREVTLGIEVFSDEFRDKFQESIDPFLEGIKQLNAAHPGHEKQFAKLISAIESIRRESELLFESADLSKLEESKRALCEGRLLSVEAFANEFQRG